MIVDLPDTTTSNISKALVKIREEGGAVALGRVLTLVISHSDHTARQSAVAYNHYSLLRTIEDGWHLGCLAATCDTADVPAMSDLVGPAG